MSPIQQQSNIKRIKIYYKKLNTIIGYSGFIVYDKCYEYNEDACFVADSKESARQFMLDCGHEDADYKIETISFTNIMKDYGGSSGEYAMEETAFQNFKKIAENNEVKFKAKEFYLDPTLMVVNVNTE